MSIKGIVRLVFGMAFLAILLLYALPSRNVYAAQITARSLTLQAGVSDGGSKPGGVVNHLFSFTVPTSANVGSIKFLYCTVAAGTCITPAGLDTTAATYGSESGATGFSLQSGTPNGAPYIKRSSGVGISNGTAVAYQLLGVTNPDAVTDCPQNDVGPSPAPSCTFFVRISTYTSTNATGSPIDTGVVAASVNNQISLTGTMPESLVFCTGGTVLTAGGIPDCSTATNGALTFNQLFSPTDTATATSQMAASTNAGSGYNISVNGLTLTSGSNTITAMSSLAAGTHGLSQFGLNLKANTSPAIGTEVAPASNGTNLRGESSAGYDTIDHFKFTTGESVADSGSGGLAGSDAQIFTVSYIVNVPGSQPAGTYTTTLTYICTPTY